MKNQRGEGSLNRVGTSVRTSRPDRLQDETSSQRCLVVNPEVLDKLPGECDRSGGSLVIGCQFDDARDEASDMPGDAVGCFGVR